MKKLFALFLVFVMLVSLTACGGDDSENYSPDTPNINPNTNPDDEIIYEDDGSDYWGFYETPEGYLIIHEDGTFEFTDFDWLTYDSGVCIFDDGVTLVSDYSPNSFFVLDEYGNLYGGEDYGTYFRVDGSGEAVYTKENYQGYWMYENGYVLLIEDDTWYCYDDTGTLFVWGPAEYDEDAAYLMNDDGSSGGGMVYFDEYGNLIDSDQALTYYSYFPYDEPVTEYEHPADFLVGEWYYSDQENILTFYDDGTYFWETPYSAITGYFTFDGEWIEFDEHSEWSRASVGDNGYIYVEGDAGSYYYRSDEF